MRRTVRVLVTAVATVGVLVGLAGPAQAVGDERARAEKLLVKQGMPREVAAKVAYDPTLRVKVKDGEVLVDGEEFAEVQALVSSTVVSAAKGSDYWYSAAVNSIGQVKSVVYLRYSWSWMWWLQGHYATVASLSGAACSFLPGALAGACGVLVAAYYAYSKGKIDEGLRLKKCLRIRFPAPPLVDYSLFRWDLVTCRV